MQLKKRIVVLGAKGNIGSAVYKALNQSSERFDVIGTSARIVNEKGMVCFDPLVDSWSVFGKVDALINCIGIIQEVGKNTFDKLHIGVTKSILNNRQTIGNPLIIQVSALGADTRHATKYLRTKGIADELLLQQDNTFVVRPSIVCFPNTAILEKIKMHQNIARKLHSPILLPKGIKDAQIQPVMISDLVEVIENVAINPPKEDRIIYAVGLERLNYGELFLMNAGASKKKIVEINQHLCDLLIKGIVARVFPSFINRDQYILLFKNNIADTQGIERILGREPLSSRPFWQKNLGK